MSYAQLSRGQDASCGWDLVILDEAHYVKNTKAKRTRTALRIAAEAKRAWLLSGTPMPNHPGELYAPMRMLWPKLVPRGYQTFLRRYTTGYYDGFSYKVTGAKNVPTLRKLLKQFMIRRTLKTIEMQLPPLRVDVHYLHAEGELPEEAQELVGSRDQMELATLRRLLGEYKAPLIARQIAEELEDGAYEKVVVLAHHRAVLSTLREALAGYGVVGFDGSTRQADRQEQIDAFSAGRPRVFVAQQTAAGVAINLQVSSEVVLVEPSWTPSENAQAVKRIHRVGSTRPCRARIFAVTGTLDESIMEAVARKTRMQESLGLD